jgi:hypothetical protein
MAHSPETNKKGKRNPKDVFLFPCLFVSGECAIQAELLPEIVDIPLPLSL